LVKEFVLDSGRRPDFVNFFNKTIYELKPNNPRSIKLGYKQLEAYRAELGAGWSIHLDLY